MHSLNLRLPFPQVFKASQYSSGVSYKFATGDISPSATRADQMPIVELHHNDLADPWSAENKLHPKQSTTTGFLFYKLMDRLSSTSSFDSSAFPHRPKPGIHHDRHNKVGRDSKPASPTEGHFGRVGSGSQDATSKAYGII
jgi:hypothetical protein